jgi:ATP-dependent Lon protease
MTDNSLLFPLFQGNLPDEDAFDNALIDFLEDESDNPIEPHDFPAELPILPLRNTVLFSGVMIPITVARDRSIQLVRDAHAKKDRLVGVVAQKNPEVDTPTSEDVYLAGTVASIMRMITMPNGSVTIFIQGRNRFKINEFTQEEPYFKAKVSDWQEEDLQNDEAKAMLISLKNEAQRIIELSPNIPNEASIHLHNLPTLNLLANFIASNLNLDVPIKQEILETEDLMQKAQFILEHLSKELQVLELSEEIQSKVKVDLDKQQRDYFLRQQIKTIQDELGEYSFENEIEEFKARAEKKLWSAEAEEAFSKELHKLNRLNSASPEYGVSLNYIEWLLDLPWFEYTKDRFNLKLTRKYLDEDHFGLDKVKERIIEYLAVLKLKANMKAPILCFYGPPGVGKTSLAKSIARSLGRNLVRISLGGVRDEAEIRGHRRTYIGAMPGRIIQGLKKAKSGNPVFVLDEIDKVGNDWRGDPSAALLEVLDPEQNNTFNDHYLEIDYDLSSIMFIATANSLDTIHPALLDRMEIVEINGYTMQEKIEIAKRHLLPKQKREHGLKDNQVIVSDELIRMVVEGYTRESGVRALDQKMAGLCRGVAKDVVENKIKEVVLDEAKVESYLGVKRFEKELYQKIDVPGVAVGLAWTQVGGEILFVECVLIRGVGRLSLTGQLGDVMKESAQVAFMYLKANADKLNIPQEAFKEWDIHIHIPAGAIPKDGPSAGVTLLSAMTSVYTQRLVKPHLAMTGEITLRGKVLPVGGIKEKLLAAVRSGCKSVILCKENEKDVKEIPADQLDQFDVHYVSHMDQVIDLALEKNPVKSNDFLKVVSENGLDDKKKAKKEKNALKHSIV